MKKILLLASAMCLPMLFAACGSKDCNRSSGSCGGKDVVYTGKLPAADVSGIRYTVHLDYDDDHNYTDGDFRMYETYVNADTTSVSGVRDLRTVRTEGDFKVETGTPSDPKMRYVKLVPDMRDSGPGASAEPVYFAMPNDSTLVMLGNGLTMPERPDDYTLVAR